MAERSLAATIQGVDKATDALTGTGWSKEVFAGKVYIPGKSEPISISTVKKFFSGKKVDRRYFVAICEALELDWEEIAESKSAEAVAEPEQTEPDIDALVQEIRGKVYDDIHHRCGTMRVLDMEQKIGIGDIYTSVNILEKLSGRRRLGIDELLQDCDLENFDRFMLGQVRHERVPGLEAVERYDKLMILGKPGAGKTTFMKRLATLCNQGEFQAQRVPVFVTLKEFAEAPTQPDLQIYINLQWEACGISSGLECLDAILEQGRALVLLDGLDEVQEADHDRVLRGIKWLTNQFRDCQFVMTCRIAAREYTFQQFTEVEVADFNQEQIEDFATKWFKTKQDPDKGKNFLKRLKDNKPIQELATNPLLLTLLCLVFGDGNGFPTNRAELYKEGLDILLKKWDAKRNIDRDQIYKKLSLKRKEDLLSQLAFKTFERSDYFFKQEVIERQIIDYIRNLPGAHEDEETLQLDSEAVLKSIEAQHGLLVERARGIYSFSHLTFQEYFAAKQITSPTSQLHSALEDLANHINENRYREIFLVTVGMLPEADNLLLLMKYQIDRLVADDVDLQALLVWNAKKAESVNSSCKLSAIRAFYFSITNAFNFAHRAYIRNLDYDINYHPDMLRALEHARAFNLEFDLVRTLDSDLDLFLDHDLDLFLVLNYALAFNHNRDFIPIRVANLDGNLHIFLVRTREQIDLAHDLTRELKLATEKLDRSNAKLKFEIEALKAQLPSIDNIDIYLQWWKEHGEAWQESLRKTLIEHRNIGHDWQFTEEQTEKLHQYFDANKLLVDCLNSDCYVTKATRQYIEDTLLLPMSEIEKYERPTV